MTTDSRLIHNPKCVICETTDSELDFHHWSYRKNVGCVVCRRCHTHIHGVDIWSPLIGVKRGPSTASTQQGVKGELGRLGLRFESWHSLMYINACLLIIDHSTFGSCRTHETYTHAKEGEVTSIDFHDAIPELNIPDIHTERYINASRFAQVYVEELHSGDIGLAKAYFRVYQ